MTTIAITMTHIDFRKVTMGLLFVSVVAGILYTMSLVFIATNLHTQKVLSADISNLKASITDNEQSRFLEEQKIVPSLAEKYSLSTIKDVTYSTNKSVAISE